MRRLVGSLIAAAAVWAAPAASAMSLGGEEGAPPRTQFEIVVVDRLTPAELARLARRGAVGLLVPGAGATTSHRLAMAALVAGVDLNADVEPHPAARHVSVVRNVPVLERDGIIVVTLPKGPRQPNDRRYPIAIVGGGFHGLLTSRTTRIPGLVSIADVAPTALGRVRGSLRSVASGRPLQALARLDTQIHANNRLKLPVLFVVAAGLLVGALRRPAATLPAILGALVANLLAGILHVANEPALMTIVVAGLVGGGLAIERLCRNDRRLLLAILAVLALYSAALVVHPDWVAVTPFGPTQDSRFWGIGNQLETLLVAPVVAGAAVAARRLGVAGFAAFAVFALLFVTDNRLGSDGGGAIVFGIALAFVGARVLRLGVRGFVTLLLVAATTVLTIVMLNLRMPGPDHLRSAFAHGPHGLVAVAIDRVPLSYLPALHAWPTVAPAAALFLVSAFVSFRRARRDARDLLVAAFLAVATSLVVNDSAAYELVAGAAALAALGQLRPAAAAWRLRDLVARAVPANEPAG